MTDSYMIRLVLRGERCIHDRPNPLDPPCPPVTHAEIRSLDELVKLMGDAPCMVLVAMRKVEEKK